MPEIGNEPSAYDRLLEEVWHVFGGDTSVPEAQDMGTKEDWQAVERDPAQFEELRQAFGLPPSGGTEPHQEPVVLAPLPAYEYPPVPGKRPTSVTPPPLQLVRDPESMTVPERPRAYAPVSHSPTRMKTRPFMPSNREPVQSAPVLVNHPASAEQPLTHRSIPAPKTITPVEELPPEPKEKLPSKITPKNYPGGKFGDKIQGQNSGGNFSPSNKTKPFTKQLTRKGAGRQRGKDRNSEDDGVRQMFELWWRKGESRGESFGTFYRSHLSLAMCKYYRRYYIRGENPKSAADYKRWRAEWEASKTA